MGDVNGLETDGLESLIGLVGFKSIQSNHVVETTNSDSLAGHVFVSGDSQCRHTCRKARSSEGRLGVDRFAEAGFKSFPR